MPVRDAEPFLGQALDCVLAQSEGDFELIAVEDGSSDRSRETLETYAKGDGRIRVLQTDVGRRGLVAALNLGLKACRAPLVARMDADDRCPSNRFALQLAALASRPELFAVTSQVEAFPTEQLRDGMRRYLAWQNSLLSPARIIRDRFVESPLVHPSVMMRTEPLRSLGGWRQNGWAEDWDLWLRAFERGLSIGRVAQPLYQWRLHPRRATLTDPRYSEESFLACRAHFLARHLAAGKRALWLLGAGPVGKRLARALAKEGLVVAGFADVDPKKIGGRIANNGDGWPVVSMQDLLGLGSRPFGLGSVGQAGGREQLRAELLEAGWKEGRDFLVAA